MKVKRKVAALLALAMVVTGQPSWVLADGLENLGGTTVVESEDIATPLVPEKENDDLEKESTPNDADEVSTAQVDYVILPEEAAEDHGATIFGPTTVDSDDILDFHVKVRDAYELSYVDVAGAEAEPVSVEDNVYYYKESDIYQDTTVTVYLEEKPEFEETVETDDGLVFEISADAGVLPAGTMVKVNPLVADYADQVKEEVLAEAKVEEEALVETLTEEKAGPLYAAYQIEFVDEEEETLSNSDIGGKVEVSVAMMEDEEAELAVYKVEEKTVEEQEEETEAEDADENTTAVNQTSVQSIAAKTASVEKAFDIEEVKNTRKITLTKESSNLAVLVDRAARAVEFVPMSMNLGTNSLPGNGTWYFVNEHGDEINDPYPGQIILDNGGWTDGPKVEVEFNQTLIGKKFYLCHSYWSWGQKKDYYEVTVEWADAYFFIKKAAYANKPDDGDYSADRYEFWGIGKIPLGSPESYPEMDGKHENLTPEIIAGLEIPTPDNANKDGYDSDGFPVLTLDGNSYYYIESDARGSSEYLYDIDWYCYTIASPTVGYDGTTHLSDDPEWHVDANVTLYDPSHIQITARWEDPNDAANPEYDFPPNNIEYTFSTREKAVEFWTPWIPQKTADLEKSLNEDYEVKWYFDKEGTDLLTLEKLKEKIEDNANKSISLWGTLTYATNGGEGGPGTTERIYINQQTVELATTPEPTRENAVFLGWSENQIESPLTEAPAEGTLITTVTFGEGQVYADLCNKRR